MKIILAVLIFLPFIACKKNHDNNQPPQPVDSLGTSWRKIALPAGAGGADVFFINNTTGFAVGNHLINRSTDGGNTWQKVYQSNAEIINIGMGSSVNALFAIQGSSAFQLLVTSNGGNTFDSVVIADDAITDVFFVSPSIAYAIGHKCWKTTNGGYNWISVSPSMFSGYKSIYFLNEQNGWCSGATGLFTTTNGGVTWNPQATPGFNYGLTADVYFIDANNGFISDGENIGKTSNGGTTWTKIGTFLGGYHDLHFLTGTTGYITDNHYIYKTTDSGNTWTREVNLALENIVELHFTDANHGWAIAGGYILKYER